MKIFRPLLSYVVFVDFCIHGKDTFVRKNNTIEKGSVWVNVLKTPGCKLSAGSVINYFKLFYNVKFVQKQVKSFWEN